MTSSHSRAPGQRHPPRRSWADRFLPGPAPIWRVALLSAVGLAAGTGRAASPAAAPLTARVVSAEAAGGATGAEHLLDSDPRSEFSFRWPNGGARIVLDLGRPVVVTGLRLTAGPSGGPQELREAAVGGRPHDIRLENQGFTRGDGGLAHHAEQAREWGTDEDGTMRPLLGRGVNLVVTPGAVTDVALPAAVARFLRVTVAAGSSESVGIGALEVLGHADHLPERHLLHWWTGDARQDLVEAAPYLADDLGVTDVWIDKLASVFPSTRPDFGFDAVAAAGGLDALRARGIRCWLAESEGVPGLVNSPADLRDERAWQTTLDRAKTVFATAKGLGFTGYVMDAEDYSLPAPDVARIEMEKHGFDHVDAWCFADEFGLDGMYYHRGRQFGRVLRDAWGPEAVMIQYYIPQAYHDYRRGNFWWLLGIHDMGVEIRLGDEHTYSAGHGELHDPAAGYPDWTTRWFTNFPEKAKAVHGAFPFVTRVYAGIHPWVTSHGSRPLYLPNYLDEQLEISGDYFEGVWLYHGGTPHAGDPRKVLDPTIMRQLEQTRNVSAERYLDVFRRQPTARGR